MEHTILIGLASVSNQEVINVEPAKFTFKNGTTEECPFFAFRADKEKLKTYINNMIDRMYEEHANLSVSVSGVTSQ